MTNSEASVAIKIHTLNDLDEVFFKRLIGMVKHGINNYKIHPHLQSSNNFVMTQKELLNWIKTDETGCLSTIQKHLQKENLILIADQDNPQLAQAFLDKLFDVVWYLATSTRTGVLKYTG